ncbi:unnamed protein product [Spirodela intermedia]|uniref:Uncharacterized protein n=1 Tax=Spirodela intermedia TaxID=51605 RepID=A0A7I8INH4_SPIIN|nr:unnamed protein product [Spirodela intermedia]CAA6659369.1 unnamed protein product [Spirodela intermedia]
MAETDGSLADDSGAKATTETAAAVKIDPMTGDSSVEEREETVFDLLRRFGGGSSSPTPQASSRRRPSRIACACRNSGRRVLLWTRRGSPLRALLVISVGTITLLALTGLAVFILFFLAATLNAIIISLLMSLAAAGGFLALFFGCLVATYIGALSVAVFIISITTIATIIAVLIAAGWIGFLWAIHLLAKKGMDIVRQSLSMTGSALSAYCTSPQAHHKESKEN